MRPREEMENQEELLSKLEQVVRDVAQKPDLIVRTELTPAEQYKYRGQDPAKIWFRQSEHIDPRTGETVPENVRIPEAILDTDDERVALGIAAHEGAHSSISRLMEAGVAQYEGEPGLIGFLMALEERPTDEEVRQWSEDGKDWISLARFSELAKDLKADTTEQVTGERTRGLVGVSKYQQLCNLLVYAREEEMDKYDPEVVKLYQEISHDVDFVETCLPERSVDEAERIRRAKVRLTVAIRKIWPRIKELYEQDKEQLQLEDLLQQILAGALSLGGAAGGGEVGTVLELPPDLAEKLSKLLPPSSADLSKAKRIKPSEELLDALREALKHIPEEKKKELEAQANKDMEAVEQELVDEHAPKVEERPRTAQEIREEMDENRREHQERAEREEERRSQEAVEQKIREESELVRREQAALLERKSAYDRVYDEVRPLEQKLYEELREVFHPKIKTKVRLKNSGTRVNLPAFMRWDMASQAGQMPSRKFFETIERPNKKNYAISLLVDLSGSMRDEKIAQTLRAVVILVEVLNRLGLNFELVGFQDELIVFKKFGEKVDDALRRKISGMSAEVTNTNPSGHNKANYNDDGPCLTEAAAGLAKQTAQNRFLVVISDGKPEGRRSNEDDLTEAVEKIGREGKVNLVALGLGAGTEHVKRFYPISLPNIRAEHLQEVLPELLKDIIERPGKYRFAAGKNFSWNGLR